MNMCVLLPREHASHLRIVPAVMSVFKGVPCILFEVKQRSISKVMLVFGICTKLLSSSD